MIQGPEARTAETFEQLNEVLRGAQTQGKQAMRQELRSQLAALQEQREEVSDALQSPMVGGADRAGLSKRIETLDGRIALIDAQIAKLDAEIAQTGALGQVLTMPPPTGVTSVRISEEVAAISALFILCVLLPISIAWARRLWRRGTTAVAAIPQDIVDRLARLDQNLDAVALEVERIGESQRFLTRAFSEQQRGLQPGAAERVEVPAREKDWQRKG